jgi:hypothetical protein
MQVVHVRFLFQVFSKAGAVKSCSVSRKKNKAGIAHMIAERKASRRSWAWEQRSGWLWKFFGFEAFPPS